jgi:heat shock protein HtpX
MVGHNGLKLRMMLAMSILFGFYAALAGAIFWTFGTGTGVLIAVLAGSVLFVGFQYKFGKWMALRSVGAEDMPEGRDGRYNYGEIHRSTEKLCSEMDIEKPRLMVADMGVPNAFAVGRKGAGVVVVSTELMRLLDRDELEGVVAHELAHIRNRDVVVMVLGQSIASLVGLAVQFGVLFTSDRGIGNFILAYVAGIVAQMVVMIFVLAISRYREYVADADAAEVIGRGDPLARALEKISSQGENADVDLDSGVNALCIFGADRSLLERVFATHPPTEKRIERLRAV